MNLKPKKLIDKFREYHFEFRHITVLFIILFSFQLAVSFINKASVKNFVNSTQDWYQKDSAEEIANLTTTALELVVESVNPDQISDVEEKHKIIQSFDIIFSQQLLTHNIQNLCILLEQGQQVIPIDDGSVLYEYLIESKKTSYHVNNRYDDVIGMYRKFESELKSNELIKSVIRDNKSFEIFVPLVLRGEYVGALYMENSPDFSFISKQLISNYDETSVIYLSLILLGLLAMYFISSYTVKERDDTQKMLMEEHEVNLKRQINFDKELIFTKRIYHTHHKAEKVMGFIKEDLRALGPENINETKYRVTKYSNFISRVIYDMKWFDPPIQTIRSSLFQTNLNEVVEFIVNNIFLRISSKNVDFKIELDLDQKLPLVHVNEFVIWEVIEPIIQNSIDHGNRSELKIICKTIYLEQSNISYLIFEDNGQGINPEMLKYNINNIKNIFVENTSTKHTDFQNSGYGCYIAYEISKRCGWEIDAENLPTGGSRFIIKIQN